MAVLTALALTVFAIGDVGAPMPSAPAVAATEADTPVSETPPSQPAYTVWDRLAACESTSNWHIISPPYYGGLQMDLTFWRRHGGTSYASRPDLASREAQIAVAEVGLHVQGWQAWPACSRRLGLR